MKIAVIGANGKTGRVFIDAALEAGHEVVAGIHRHNTLEPQERLTVVSCNTTNEADIARLIIGCDAVVSLIGHGRHSPAHLQTDTMRHLVAAMRAVKITRLISLTGDGVREPGDKIGLIDRLGNMAIKMVDPKRITDGIAHADYLRSTELEYTILRVFKLTNGPLRPFVLTPHGPALILVPRRSVAVAILDCLERSAHLQQTPIIGSLK